MRPHLKCDHHVLLKSGSNGVLTDQPMMSIMFFDSTDFLKGTCIVSVEHVTCNTVYYSNVALYSQTACHRSPLPWPIYIQLSKHAEACLKWDGKDQPKGIQQVSFERHSWL